MQGANTIRFLLVTLGLPAGLWPAVAGAVTVILVLRHRQQHYG
jgi:hypothetical protein